MHQLSANNMDTEPDAQSVFTHPVHTWRAFSSVLYTGFFEGLGASCVFSPPPSLTKSRAEGGTRAGDRCGLHGQRKDTKETLENALSPFSLAHRARRLGQRLAQRATRPRDDFTRARQNRNSPHRPRHRPSQLSLPSGSPLGTLATSLPPPLPPLLSRTLKATQRARARLPAEPVSINFSPFFVCFACHSARIFYPPPPTFLSLSLFLLLSFLS